MPELIARRKEIAGAYLPNPGLLLTSDQREALMPGLFMSFLTVQLVAAGWVPSHSEREGLILLRHDKRVNPSDAVHTLLTGELSHEAFRRLIA